MPGMMFLILQRCGVDAVINSNWGALFIVPIPPYTMWFVFKNVRDGGIPPLLHPAYCRVLGQFYASQLRKVSRFTFTRT